MDERANYLKSVLSAIRSDLVPELSSDMARLRSELIGFVVSRIVAELSQSPEMAQTYLSTIARDLKAVGGQGSADLTRAVQTILQASKAGSRPDHIAVTDDAEIAGAVSALLDPLRVNPNTASGDRAARDAVVRAIASAEHGYRDAFEALVRQSAQSIVVTKSKAEAEARISDASLTAYLRKRFPDKPGIRASGVKPIPGGRSKGTTLFLLEGYDSAPREVVMRQDLAAQVAGLPVPYEYPVLRRVWEAGLAVAEPLFCEDNETELGGAFIVFAKAEGKPGGTLFSMGAPAAAARDMAAFFGRLHSIDIDKGDLRDKLVWGRDESPVRAMLDSYYERWLKVRTTPSTLMETAFLWLYDHLDVIAPKSVLVHGDSSYHNVLIHDGRVSVVLDWEFAHAGDPAEDLLGAEHYTTEVMPWDEYIKIYRDNGGQDISKGRFHFFALWRSLRFAVTTYHAWHVYKSGADRDLRLATIGYTSTPRLQQDIAKQLAAASTYSR